MYSDSGKYSEDYAKFIDSTLLQHDCSKIKKLHLAHDFERDSNFSSKIRFATRKHVEELILDCESDTGYPYLLPKFLLHNDCLVKLEPINCRFVDDCPINWGSLKALNIEDHSYGKFIVDALLGTPSLESLEINPNGALGGGDYLIVSKSLKVLTIEVENESCIEILCPNLEELSVKADFNGCLTDETIANVVYGCLLLRFLELENCNFDRLVIASKSLKKLILRQVMQSCSIEISCPNLEKLCLYALGNGIFKVMDFPSLICAALDFEIRCSEHVAERILEQLKNVKELSMGSSFIKILSDVEMKGLSYPWSNNKILTLDAPNFEHLPGILCALRNSPVLERLVMKFDIYEVGEIGDLSDLNASGENYWNSNGTVVNCLLLHLKTVEINGLPKQDAKCKSALKFIEFLLKNARVLEKLVLKISKHRGKDFAFTVLQKVSSFRRCSQHAIVELFYSK